MSAEEKIANQLAERTSPLSKSLAGRIRRLHMAKHRRQEGLCLVEGPRPIEAALEAGVSPRMVIAQDGWITRNPMAVAHWIELGVSQALWRTADTDEMAQLATTNSPPGVLAVMAADADDWGEREQLPPLEYGLGMLLWVGDAGNLGTMLRLAWASGVKGVWLNTGCVDVWNTKVVRAAAGAHFHLPWTWVTSGEEAIAQAQVPPNRVLIADPHEGIPLWEAATQPNALIVMGHETNGLPEGTTGTKVRIPMPGGAESLNVATAAGIMLYEAIRQQQTGEARVEGGKAHEGEKV